jgi:hypothetical protein
MTPASHSAWRNLLILKASVQSSSATTPWSTLHPLIPAKRLKSSVTALTNALVLASDALSASRSWSTAAQKIKILLNALTM